MAISLFLFPSSASVRYLISRINAFCIYEVQFHSEVEFMRINILIMCNDLYVYWKRLSSFLQTAWNVAVTVADIAAEKRKNKEKQMWKVTKKSTRAQQVGKQEKSPHLHSTCTCEGWRATLCMEIMLLFVIFCSAFTSNRIETEVVFFYRHQSCSMIIWSLVGEKQLRAAAPNKHICLACSMHPFI